MSREFLSLYHTIFQNESKERIIRRRKELLEVLNGDIFYHMNVWPQQYILKFWNKPISDQETFELFLFFIGNGCSPYIAGEWILLSQYWADSRRKEKRARQLDFIFDNKDPKAGIWFYYDLYHKDWRFGVKRMSVSF